MKTTISAVVVGLLLIGAGCVSTVNERKTGGMPFVKDKVQGRYEKSVDQLFTAAKEVIKENGILMNESTLYRTNAVRTVEGKVNQRSVWVRIEAIDPKVTEVTVQTRTPGGGADIYLAHELEKQIALKLK
jgi:outer membrane murein-binding lipoprotein Lpp